MLIEALEDKKATKATLYRMGLREVAVIYYSLVGQYERYVKDLHTHYDGDPRWSQEDEDFLGEEIDKIVNLVRDMFDIDLPSA